jgi:hypothetical protein
MEGTMKSPRNSYFFIVVVAALGLVGCGSNDSSAGLGCADAGFDEAFLKHCDQFAGDQCAATKICALSQAAPADEYCRSGSQALLETVGCQPIKAACTLLEVFAHGPNSAKVYRFADGCLPYGWVVVPSPCPK